MTVIDLARVVAQHPKIAYTERSRAAVMHARHDGVHLTADGIAYAPFPLVSRVALALNFELLCMPVAIAHDRRIVEFFDDVVTGRPNVEIQTPIDMVGVDVTGASILCPCETEAWADRPIRVQAPLRDVPIPAGPASR